jgi:hypothetical protein
MSNSPSPKTDANAIDNVLVGRSRALEKFGYTPRHARFIALVAQHSGYFLRRHWLSFAGLAHGHSTVEFLAALVSRGHVRLVHSGTQGTIYHVASRPLYAAIGDPDNRNRRQLEPSTIMQKLMVVDLILALRDPAWYGTERDKVALFTEHFGLDKAILPAKTYPAADRSKPATTVRYFVEKWPIGISQSQPLETVASSSCVTLTYFSYADRTTDGFASFLRTYGPLIAKLPVVKVVYVCCGADWGQPAHSVFARRYRSQSPNSSPSDPSLPAKLLAHFKARHRLEAGEIVNLSVLETDRLRCDLNQFRGPFYDRLYHAWQSNGDAAVARCLPKNPAGRAIPVFEAYHLPYDYSLLRPERETA